MHLKDVTKDVSLMI